MPRSEARPAASAPSTTRKSHKRHLSSPPVATPGSRSSKRLKSASTVNSPATGHATPRKSKYFERSDSDEQQDQGSNSSSGNSGGSAYEEGHKDEDSVAEPSSASASESEEDYDSEEETRPKKRKGRKPASESTGITTTAIQKSKELWRHGVKTGLGPGKQVYIEKPRPRRDGGIRYVPERIHPNTMAFLADLKKNNDREWLKMHDPDYRTSWKDWESFVECLTAKIKEKDETIPELPPKDLVFRIYRDVRFTSDPTPYKPHFSAAWSRTGRKGPYAGYYVQIQPSGKSFVGAGLWMPEAAPLSMLRRDVDRKPHKIKQVLTDAAVRKHIFGGISKDEKKAIKIFASQNTENALKTKPKGYGADNENIELLRLRNYTMGRKLKDEEVLGADALEVISELIGVLTPFVTYLNSIVMPDDASSSGESDNEEEGAEG